MKCPMCEKGELRRKTVDVVKHGLFVGHFKADVCNHCGEEIMDSNEALKVERKFKEMGLWGKQDATVYQVGGNLVLGIKKSLAQMLGLSKGTVVRIFPQVSEKRLIVEMSTVPKAL